MKRKSLVSGLLGLTLLAALLPAQRPPSTLRIDDNGVLAGADNHHHRRVGEKVSWVRSGGAAQDWYVTFNKKEGSPCVEGAEFGRGLGKPTCTIKPGAKGTYNYSTATCQSCTKHDPDIIVDE